MVKKLEQEIERLNRLQVTLSQINKTILRVRSREELFQEACRITTEHTGFKVVWIGWHDRETQAVIPVGRAGNDEGYLDNIQVYADNRPEGQGPVGTCIREDKPCVFNDFLHDPRSQPWHEAAAAHGIRAVTALPIHFNEEVCGALAVYAAEPDVFRDKEIALLEEAAADISFALDNLEREAQRQRAERALTESRERYRSLFENMLDGYAYCRMFYEAGIPQDFIYLDVNPAFEKLTGLKNVVGKKVSEVIPGLREANPELFEIYGRVALTAEPERFETYVDSLGIWFSISVYSPEKEHFVVVFDNVTERTKLQRELALRERRLNSFFTGATAGLVLLDKDLRYIHINGTLAEMNGLPVEDHLGRTVREVVPQLAPLVEPIFLQVLTTGEPALNIEVSGETGNQPGIQRHWVESFFPIAGTDGSPDGVGAIVVEITDRKQAEQQIRELNASLERRVAERTAELEAANHELESFSYSVSHDLRAPLRAISGFIRALAEDFGNQLDATGQGYQKRVLASADRMGQLIEDLLSLSRITQSNLVRQPVDLSKLARSIAEDLRQREPERQAEFIIADNIILDGDPQLLRILVENLLANAWKFTSKKSTSRIEIGSSTDQGGRHICFVRDNGAGFDMNYADKLFGAFQRLHSSSDFPGSGIGLATVQRIINRHRGRVWAEAKINEGATFYFFIP